MRYLTKRTAVPRKTTIITAGAMMEKATVMSQGQSWGGAGVCEVLEKEPEEAQTSDQPSPHPSIRSGSCALNQSDRGSARSFRSWDRDQRKSCSARRQDTSSAARQRTERRDGSETETADGCRTHGQGGGGNRLEGGERGAPGPAEEQQQQQRRSVSTLALSAASGRNARPAG
ncbi:hypothetical protein Q5P01_000719 [Channa striata]|uniref:Uncharacterized protein n=1 Tax=Channa striata TaxID=64152 RepID=A0AA88IRM2_CHASR|nr:hypothetical protein Q5P01_000719 [Channa striata]